MRGFRSFYHLAFDRRDGYAPSGNLLYYGSGFAYAQYFQLYNGSGRTPDMVDCVGEVESFEFVSSHFRYDVSTKDSRLLRGRSREYLLDRNAEFALVDHGSDAFEISGERFVEFFRLVYVEVRTVFVPEGIDHALYHSRFEIVTGNRIETVVIILKDAVRFVEPGKISDGIPGFRNLGLYDGDVSLSKQVSVDHQFRVWGGQYAYTIRYDREGCQEALRF